MSSTLLTALSQLSTFDHFFSFARGVIDLKDVTYFVLFIALFLFLTLRSMESRRWRGGDERRSRTVAPARSWARSG